jgi:hypothetical protein
MLIWENAESSSACQCIRAEKNGNMKKSALDATPFFIDNPNHLAALPINNDRVSTPANFHPVVYPCQRRI